MTIDELARRVAMSTRNIREWQRQGLLPPPARRGRIGVYSDDHLAQIERVQKLHADGFPLDLIRRMIDSDAGNEADIRQVAGAVLAPFSHSGPTTISRAELEGRFGADAAAHLAKLGLVADASDDPVTVTDAETLNLLEHVIQVGVPLGRLVDVLLEINAHQHAIAETMLRAYAEEVWQPFVASNFTAPDWGSLAGNLSQARPLTGALLAHLQATALDDVAAAFVLRELPQAEQALGKITAPRE